MTMEKSLGEALPEEQARVRVVLGHYKEIGPAGMFGAMMIEQSLAAADRAVMSGDVVAMLAAYQNLREITG
jgi:acyl-CoA thioesterase